MAGSLTRPRIAWATSPVAGSVFQFQLIESLVLLFLSSDVVPNHGFVPPRWTRIPTRPEVLPDKVPFSLPVNTRQMNRALPLYGSDPLELGRRARHQARRDCAHARADDRPSWAMAAPRACGSRAGGKCQTKSGTRVWAHHPRGNVPRARMSTLMRALAPSTRLYIVSLHS